MTTIKAYRQLTKSLEEALTHYSDGLISNVEYGITVISHTQDYLHNLKQAYTEKKDRVNVHLKQLDRLGY